MKNSKPSDKKENNIPELDLLAFIAVAAVLRKEAALRRFLQKAKKQNIKAEKIYETLLQTYLFAGFPSALISLSIMSEYFNPIIKTKLNRDYILLKNSGVKTCKRIYGNKYDKLIKNIANYSRELSEWLVIEGYGKVLSRRGLALKDREVINVAVLSALKFENQLYSHINGAYKNKAGIKIIENVILSLKTFDKKLPEFGISVLQKYIKQKGITI